MTLHVVLCKYTYIPGCNKSVCLLLVLGAKQRMQPQCSLLQNNPAVSAQDHMKSCFPLLPLHQQMTIIWEQYE